MPVAKSATLRFYLIYSPIWIAAVVVTLLTQAFTGWRDLGHMLFGIALGAPILVWPLLSERDVPLRQRYSLKAALFVTLLAFLQNYFGTPLFFNQFGLSYHFHVTLLGNGSPWFLSFMTIAYFATYFAVLEIALHAVEKWLGGVASPGLRGTLRFFAAAALSYFVALLETLTMQNPLLAGYFSYGDKARMMFVGSVAYGTLLLCGLLVFVRIDENPKRKTPLVDVIWQVLGANTLVLCAYEVYAHLLSR